MSEPRLDLSWIDPGKRKRSPWWGIHAARYRFAEPYVAGRRVLDIACGTGYGMAILRAGARAVVGVDGDLDAVRLARRERSGASALAADALALPFAAGAFEVVTSFETIEHLHERDRFLAELRRVLRPEGVLILSTPNANYTEPIDGTPRNPFHVHEYDPQELERALHGQFRRVDLLGQELDPRFKISPFWDDQQKLPAGIGVRAPVLAWRVFNRLPYPIGDRLSRLALGQALIPDERGYRFSADCVSRAPVLVALCRG